MLVDLLWLVIGLILILVGADWLTDGASAIAKRLGISDLIIGLTVVAFGTSAPELVISIISAANGSADLATGNVVGSNIFNIMAILGVTAIIRPIVIKKSVMTNEIPMVLLSSVILIILANSSILDHTAENDINRVDGIMLLIFFLLFMRYTFASARNSSTAPGADPSAVDGDKLRKMSAVKSTVLIVLGLAGLIWGGQKFVDGASGFARELGVSDAVIGLTIVAIGTSLPELATSIIAAVKNEPGLAIGNVIGSNIFNVLFVLGTSAVVAPLPFKGVTMVDLGTLLLASVLFLVFGWFFKRRVITRAEGAVFCICYIAYMTYLVTTAI